jgi:hypothetical protein
VDLVDRPSSTILGSAPGRKFAVVGAERVNTPVSISDAIEILTAAFAAGMPTTPSREAHDGGGVEFLLMPAWSQSRDDCQR